ncbi:MAG TPA: 30S ribosomal protein S9 [Nevskiaceae bacterium]|nr:30S ribosomal protein S9 [Nevskiaceae bacterium]
MPKTKSKPRKKACVYAVGRRKTASARVRLFRGKGKTLVNNQPIEEYFPSDVAKAKYQKPFQVTDSLSKFYATIKVVGSGRQGQLDAVVHGVARALDKENKELYHAALKKHKLLTRDPRARERRKPGLGGKARRKKQSPKR